ncbi:MULTISPECIES: arylamine N-acetyltransferase [Lysinibacillus]|jgi:arylamine N-acetyltransferase|uniref:N-hydroxyarylamine O-acetyltransferase n=1 Tax=Lysinibacillus fusiformis TaxID=28031 RepID=A0A2I0UWN2_9BACI|nr:MULTISPECIES: arylamine N-acetyltransferase [Lysinibacillus]PKU50455.1 N-hydroxyarylamine O-acetyltransferase [Lysinibacillus fusiformis]WCH47169.1 arylamine N-acetyltransferase [Lysinibacillus sp. OF-1]SCZ11788.1 N-hydroxyarylamine O-acetyltransferase [Lysinibacillus sp. SG9]SDB39715.1 N-hydroxyarylamine O-acetyltransferase [Lysinibacillus sp. TC-37]SFT20373.1 N-hydroxyarylamine O-acetyltransferase [Lysinibacillus sp. SG55]
MNSQIHHYLQHIQFQGSLEPTIQLLGQLQTKHLLTIPYENLDVALNRGISFAIPDLYQKIMVERRGGNCFELNILFSWLLRELGFSVTNRYAQFWRNVAEDTPTEEIPMHQLLLINEGGQTYISDVGVGALAPCKPVPLIAGHQHREGQELYKIERDEANGWMLFEQTKQNWRLLYSFHDDANEAKFAPRLSQQKNKIAMIRTTRGRHTMMNNEFRIYEGSSLTIYTTHNDKEWLQALQRFFHITLQN